MLKDIKKIILSQKVKSNERVIELQQYISDQEKDLLQGYEAVSDEEIRKQANELSKQINAEILKRRSIFSRLFKKEEYRKLIKDLTDNECKLRKMIIAREAIENSRKRLNDELYFIEYEIDRAKTITELGLDYSAACDLLKQNGINLVLDDSDKEIVKNRAQFHGLKDFILVHKTRYLPVDGMIKTNKEIGVMNKEFVIEKFGEFNAPDSRNTVHFAVNGEVSSHSFGNWDDCKYAILLPFNQLPVSQLRSGAVMDTFIEGGITLPKDAVILCPDFEREEAAKNNPELTVIGYQGQNVTGFADVMVGLLGYKVESVGMWSWAEQNDTNSYYEILKEEYPQMLTTPHFYTDSKLEETTMKDINIFTSLLEKIMVENIQLTDDDIKKIIRSYLYLFPSNDSQIEREKLFNKIINELQNTLLKYGMQVSPNVLNRLSEIIKDDNSPVSEEEKLFFTNVNGASDYIFPSRYADFLLKYDILSQVRERQKEVSEIQR